MKNKDFRRWFWDDTRTFLAVARNGTLSGAASELKLSIATLSRRIERLEDSLKLPLFIRHQSGYQLTDEGRALIEKAEAMENAATAFISDISTHTQLTGSVRLATAENLANNIIVPALPKFYKQYPKISIELLTDITTVNLHRRDADLALRMIKPEHGNVTFRRLATFGYGLYAHSEYIAQRNVESDINDYTNDSFITWNEGQAHLPSAKWIEKISQGRSHILATSTLAAQIIAAKAKLGLAVLPHFLAVKEGLTCIDPNIDLKQSIYLVTHSDLMHSPRVRAVADFLCDLIENSRDFYK